MKRGSTHNRLSESQEAEAGIRAGRRLEKWGTGSKELRKAE